MAGLARVQEHFQALLLGKPSEIESHVVGTARVPIATRLAIYGDGYCLRLIEALQANFPALAKMAGDDEFARMGAAYVRANDSVFRSVRYYGAGLPDFLATQTEYADAPVLCDLAWWEWLMTEVFDAADAEPLSVAALATVDPDRWGDLRFDFHPSVRRVSLHWNAPQIWRALTEDVERPSAAVQKDAAPWLLWRQDLQTYFRSLAPAEAEALDAARGGASFGELCEGLSRHFTPEETPAQAAGFLKRWLEAGMICSVRADQEMTTR